MTATILMLTLLWALVALIALYRAHRAHVTLQEHARAILALSQALVLLMQTVTPQKSLPEKEDDEYH